MLVSYVIWLDLPPKLEEYNREHCSVWWNNRPNAGYIIRVVIRKIRRLKSSRFTHQLTTTCWKRKIIHLITSYLTQQTGKLGGWGGGSKVALSFFFLSQKLSLFATLMAQGITEPFKVKGDFSHLPSSVDSALHLSWFGLPLHWYRTIKFAQIL